MESHKQIEDRAAAYLAQRDSGEWTAADQVRFDDWIRESIAHRVAFLRLESVWDEALRLKALSAGIAAGTVPPPGDWRQSPFFDRDLRSGCLIDTGSEPGFPGVFQEATQRSRTARARVFATAAIVLLALGSGIYRLGSHLRAGERYSTPVGGIASVPLRDGSNITLNTATQVRVEITPLERHIRLDKGEAFFQVAHDPNRPFVVQVGHKRVIAVGTKFSVRVNGNDIRVVVSEGKVRVESEWKESPQTGPAGLPGMEQGGVGEALVTAGNVASASDEGVVVQDRGLTQVQGDLSWRQGYLTFHDTSLADAVAEFNRYNAHKIRIDDPQIAAIRISGTFRALNSEAFVRVLGDGFAIHARGTDDSTTLTE